MSERGNRERDVGRGGMLSEKGKPGKRCRQGRHVVMKQPLAYCVRGHPKMSTFS